MAGWNREIRPLIVVGGMFAAWAMFKEPGLFNRFIISGPALLWDNEAIFGCKGEYARNFSGRLKSFLETLNSHMRRRR